jgi:hypothetical protein
MMMSFSIIADSDTPRAPARARSIRAESKKKRERVVFVSRYKIKNTRSPRERKEFCF